MFLATHLLDCLNINPGLLALVTRKLLKNRIMATYGTVFICVDQCIAIRRLVHPHDHMSIILHFEPLIKPLKLKDYIKMAIHIIRNTSILVTTNYLLRMRIMLQF